MPTPLRQGYGGQARRCQALGCGAEFDAPDIRNCHTGRVTRPSKAKYCPGCRRLRYNLSRTGDAELRANSSEWLWWWRWGRRQGWVARGVCAGVGLKI